jgi:hypothetical protein
MEHKDNDHSDDDDDDDDDNHPDDDLEYQECQLCCEKTKMIIHCLNEPCDYLICDKCYSRIDDKCPACRTSLTEYKKDLIAEKIIIEIDDNEIDNDSDTNPRRNSRHNTSPIIYDITQFPNDISCCSVICILILLLTFPILKFFELGGILIQKFIELNTYLSQYITYQRFKIFSSIVLFIFLFRTIGWVTLKSIENEEIQAYISYNYFDIFGFLLGFGIGIITILLFFGLSIIYFRSVLWVVLKIAWLYKKMIRYLYPQDDQQQQQQIN